MLSQWLQMEYYRLDCVETWEDGPRKQATRAPSSMPRRAREVTVAPRPLTAPAGCLILVGPPITHSRAGWHQFPSGFSICSTT
jgi:hypothetical protein